MPRRPKPQNSKARSTPTLHLHRQRQDQQFELRFRNSVFGIDLALSRPAFHLTVQDLRHGLGEWRE
jgi:hypothetical protein